MRLLLFFAMIAAGGAAALTWLVPSTTDGSLAVVTDIGAGGAARVGAPKQNPDPVVIVYPGGEAHDPGSGSGKADGTPRFFGFALSSVSKERSESAAAQSASAAAQPWSTEVVKTGASTRPEPKTRSADVAAAMVLNALPATAPPREMPRHDLVRELQRELRRVGCYPGDSDGSWGAGSKRSMRAFLDRVGSNLPSDEPDMIQLTLVRGYAGVACRGTPTTATANAPVVAPAPVAVPVPRVARLPQAFVPPPQPAGRVAPPPIVTATPLPVAPVQPVQQTAAVPSRPVQPLEGRMSVGAPTVPPPDSPAAAGSLTMPPSAAEPSPAPQQRPARVQQRTPQRAAAPSRPRRSPERNWTATFFNR